MKTITLHSASVRNDGGYVDAGSDVEVGDKPGQIAADRAKQLVQNRQAAAVTAPRKPKSKTAPHADTNTARASEPNA